MRMGSYAAIKQAQRQSQRRSRMLYLFGAGIAAFALWNALRSHSATHRHTASFSMDTEAQLTSMLDKLGDFPVERFSAEQLRGHLRATFGGESDLAVSAEREQEPEEGAGAVYAVHQFLMQYTRVLLCGHDPSAAVLRPPNGTRYLLAADFHDSAAVLPNFIVQAMRLLLALPPGDLYVSVYESGSSDNSAHWLELLRMLLFVAGAPHSVTANGDLLRAPGQDRVRHLATIRNAALLPLTTGAFPADYVLFANDVFFCADDALRLMQHRADLACGLDLKRSFYSLPEQRRRDAMAASLQRRSRLPAFLARALAASGAAYRLWKGAGGGARAVERDLPLLFYDTWVARDMAGRRLQRGPPYSADQSSAFRLQQGLPVRAYCCWNGLALVAARHFARGLRFRAHQPRECPSSECSLLCDDLHRLGAHDVVLDPGVRVAYTWGDALDRHRDGALEGVGGSGWEHVATHTPWRQIKMAQPRRTECCALRMGAEQVDFEHDCSWYRPYEKNFTAAAIAGLAA